MSSVLLKISIFNNIDIHARTYVSNRTNNIGTYILARNIHQNESLISHSTSSDNDLVLVQLILCPSPIVYQYEKIPVLVIAACPHLMIVSFKIKPRKFRRIRHSVPMADNFYPSYLHKGLDQFHTSHSYTPVEIYLL